MKHRTKLLLLAVMCLLVLPLVVGGNAWAISPVTSSTYNPDAAIHDATSGGWDLPSNFFCVGPPASWDGTGAIPYAVERDDLATPGSSPIAPSGCNVANINATAKAAIAALGGATCIADGYSYSSYAGKCSGTAWTMTDPDYVSGQTNIEPWYTDHKGCLRCHNTVYMATHDPTAAKETYLQGGHKNMLQKADGLPVGYPTGMNPSTPPYIGNSATILSTDTAGDAFNWASGGTTGSGVPYNATYTPAGGSAIPLFWVAGFSGLEGTWPHAIADEGGSYSCGRCHATGWSSDASPNTAKEPEYSFPGVSSSTSTSGHAGVYLGGSIATDTNKYASWDRWGIQCSRCHYATGEGDNGNYGEPSGGHTTFPESAKAGVGGNTGGDINALCMNCHRQETGGLPNALETAGFLNASCKAAGSPYTCCTGSKTGTCNQSDTNPGGTLYITPNTYTGGVLTTLGSFSGHSHANQFLNSPHGQFTGTWGQIGCPPVSYSPAAGTYTCDSSMTAYGSDFVNYTGAASGSKIITQPTGQGGACTACHDVHNTVIDNAAGQDAAGTAACVSCHTNSTDTYAPQIDINAIRHPSGAGTPLDSALYSAPADPCAVCHMPAGQHIFRINTSDSYVEFPAGSPVSATAPNSDNVNVTWVDLNSACGQCHGGDAGATATKNGAPYFTTAALSTYATGMHNGVSTGTIVPPTPSVQGNAIGVDSNWKATATDTSAATSAASTPPASSALQSVTMAWGDGVVTTQPAGTTSFSHTYLKAGSYTVTQTATDTDGGSASTTYTATVANPSFSGTVMSISNSACTGAATPAACCTGAGTGTCTSVGISGAYVWLTRTSPQTNTYLIGTNSSGAYSFSNLAPGTYGNIWVTKSGYNFTCSSTAKCTATSPLAITSTNK